MRKHGIRHVIALVALAALALGGLPTAAADEPPPDDFPPPVHPKDNAKEKADAPAPPPATQPPAEARPPAAKPPVVKPPAAQPPARPPVEAWSPPAVTPGGTGSALPPPQIIRRGGRTPVAQQPPAESAPILDVPTAPRRTPLLRPPPPAPPAAKKVGPRLPVVPTARTRIAATTLGTRVFGVSKTHNVPLTGGDLALRMDVDYEVRGQDGSNVYVGIWFVRRDTGKHIRAAMATYADPSGFVTLQTRTARVRGNAGRFTATLKIPYRAFPVARANESYEVEARVQILRAEAQGRATSLAKSSTTFRVYGYSEDEPVEDGA